MKMFQMQLKSVYNHLPVNEVYCSELTMVRFRVTLHLFMLPQRYTEYRSGF